MAKNTNPHSLTTGSRVMLPVRQDGVAHRDGNDAVWEVTALHLDGAMATLHLVGAPANRTAGAATKSLRPVK